jgi:GDPmannose 4,6-dehydratase
VEEIGTVARVNTPDLAVTPGQRIVAVDPRYFRPTEVETLLGDPSHARESLGWVPRISFGELVQEMVRKDLEDARRDKFCSEAGFNVCAYNE